MPDIQSEIRKIVSKELQISDATSIKTDSRLKEDLKADDLDVIDIAMVAAEHYGVEIEDEEFAKVILVSDLARIIQSAKKVPA